MTAARVASILGRVVHARAMTVADRYVAAADIRAAVRGHETDILDGLGIDWKQPMAKPHTRCPYQVHIDANPSWRWDPRKRKAFYTCGARDVLGVLIGVEGIGFEPAKIRAAELLNRLELIEGRRARKSKGGGSDIPPEQYRNGAAPGGCRLADYAAAKRRPIDFLRSLGLAEMAYQGVPAVKIPYFTMDDADAAVRFRPSALRGR